MQKMGKRPAAQQAGEPVVNRLRLSTGHPEGVAGKKAFFPLVGFSHAGEAGLARRRRRHIAKRCLVGH
jgi:hypothetical protein